MHSFFQPIFSLFSHLNSALQNLVIELYSALKIFKIYILQLFIKVMRSFVAIELLNLFNNEKFHFCCSRELSVFWLNKLYSLNEQGSIQKTEHSSELIY